MSNKEEWLSPLQLAELFGISRQTAYRWRYEGVGPKSYKVGNQIRYRRSEIEGWLEGQSKPKAAVA